MREDLVRKMGEAAAIAAGEIGTREQATVNELVSAYASLFASALKCAYRAGMPYLTLECAVWDVLAQLTALQPPKHC